MFVLDIIFKHFRKYQFLCIFHVIKNKPMNESFCFNIFIDFYVLLESCIFYRVLGSSAISLAHILLVVGAGPVTWGGG